jgi:hypothetical protein
VFQTNLCLTPTLFTVAAACAEWEGVFGCKDKLLGGRLSVNLQRKHLEYRKSITMGGSSQLSIRGSCMQTQARPRLASRALVWVSLPSRLRRCAS